MAKVELNSLKTNILAARGLLKSPPFPPFSLVCIADPVMEDLAFFLQKMWGCELFFLPKTFEKKSPQLAWHLLQTLFEKKIDRTARLVAIGGGSTSDLVGFVASIYFRGIPWIAIPTTLLAAVDASIGGKTGLDTFFAKNGIGSFHPPEEVWIDWALFDALSSTAIFHGMAEIWKLSLVWDGSLWDLPPSDELFYRALLAKQEIVSQDPFDKGIRRILNFGHTIGHALETVLALPHGEAVALGTLAEARLSFQKGLLSLVSFEKIEAHYRSLPLSFHKVPCINSCIDVMQRDKKNSAQQIHSVLIEEIGKAAPFDGKFCSPIETQLLIDTLDWLYG